MNIKNKERARLALAELEKEMEILTKEQMNACKGGGDGTQSNPYTWTEYESLVDNPNFTGGWVMDSGNLIYGLGGVTVTGSSGNRGNIRMVFDRSEGNLSIYGDRGTPNDTTDDIFLNSFPAHNNVTRNSNGIWSNGTYSFIDTNTPHCHGSDRDRRGILNDSSSGSFGENGIYRVENFYDERNNYREGMGVHAGREHLPFEQRVTLGCIRTTPEAMEYLQGVLSNGSVLTGIIVQD